jgi:hypothetical protein
VVDVVKKNDGDSLEKVIPFIDRFISRFIQCCHDIDNTVAVEALKFMNHLLTSGILGSDDIEVEDEDIACIDALMFDESRNSEV